ncbi:hypothetical protein BEP19_09230 [Ammoniphilus oxalaticus]|uniref:Uncharacterized protein n=1 Tax=Ammoniphilus oxalaticus TaxID=66863 RepID=A0A419SKQ2_9BACL|nr:hypothetical protein [Ammoniphilus oxalaticus]RKD24552.1 hypothetical protein BEP19_09230 [Ammoniphilus oxalaticus]
MRKIVRWFFLVLATISPFFIFIFTDTSLPNSKSNLIDIRFGAASWMVTGVVGFLGFIVLYLTIIFENRIFNNIRGIEEYYYPYALDYSDIQRNLQNYVAKSKKKDLIFLYYSYLLSVWSLNIMWCTLLKHYSQTPLIDIKLILKGTFSVYELSGILMYGLGVSFWLITLLFGIVLCLVINQVNILGKSKLPDTTDLTNVGYLYKSNADTSEIIFKCSPQLNIYRFEDKFEVYLESKLSFTYVTYLFKFYRHGEDFKFNIYYKIEGENNNKYLILQNKIKEINFEVDNKNEIIEYIIHEDLTCELEVFTNCGETVGRYLCIMTNENKHHYNFKISKKVLYDKMNLEKTKIPQLNKGSTVEGSY